MLQYFRPSLSYHLSLRPLFCPFLSSRIRQDLLYIAFFPINTPYLSLPTSAAIYFSKLTFLKHSFRNAVRVPNSLDPDQAHRFVGPDLGPNYSKKVISRRHYISGPNRVKLLIIFIPGWTFRCVV